MKTEEPRRATIPAELAGGKYEVIRELGRGGTAMVYLARERATGHEWAVKVIQGQFGNDTDTIKRFEREAELVARLQHPGIVAIHSMEWLGDGAMALVMDYIPGRTAKQIIQDEGPLSFERAHQWLDEVADALAYAHAHGVVHRDVKPENIFVNERTGRAVLADFGIARSLQNDTQQLTLTGVAIGTPTYMAPEQVDSKGVDARSDLYSLGVVGWEMLTGRRPWDGETLYEIIYRLKTDELPAIDAIRPDAPERLVAAIEGLLVKSVADRWQSAAQFRTQLTTGPVVRRPRVSNTAPAFAETIVFRPPRANPVTRSRYWLAPTTVAASLLISATWVFARGDSGRWLTSPGPATHPESVAHQPVIPSSAVASAAIASAAIAGRAHGVDNDMLDDETESGSSDPWASSHLASASGMLPPTDPHTTSTIASPPASLAAVGMSAAPVSESHASSASVRSGSNAAQRYTVVAGMTNTCLASPGGDLQCWGSNGARTSVGRDGQIRFARVSAGASSTCAITTTRDAYCWGDNESGQLGDGTGTARTTPTAVVGNYAWTSIATGSAHACAVSTDARVFCWGNGRAGQLGNGATTNASRPVAVSGVKGIAFATVVTGWNHSCALTTDKVAYCWGDNRDGALGDGTRDNRSKPVPVHTTARFIMLAAGSAHTCGITTSNTVLCWGQNTYGQLGVGAVENGDRTPTLLPTRIHADEPFVTIAAGGVHTCAVGRDNDAWCWGRNEYGQLGDGSTVDRFSPTPVSGGHHFASVASFGAHTCGTTLTDELFCWGYNLNGQIGDGTREHRLRPTYVEKRAE